jgi:Peptidase inhibitor family I36
MRRAVLFACFAVLATSSVAMAQRWGREGVPRDGVCFYKDPNFNGDYFCARSGDSLASVPDGMNDRISSVRVFGRTEVIVFRDIRFAGRSSRFDNDVRNLKDVGWNDLISSIRVRSASGGGFGGRPGGGDRDRPGGGDRDRPGGGDRDRPGGGDRDRPGGGFGGRQTEDPDRIVRRAYQDILEREPDANGLRLYRTHIIDEGWTEAQVRDDLRNSREYREKNSMTPAKAQDIVRRAYLAVLKREPDPGSQGMVQRVLRDHWTQQDVERELRNSAEYRNKR